MGGNLQLSSSHTVTHPHNWPWHLVSLQIYQMQQVSCMVVPTRLIAQKLFIQNAALALLRQVGNPYASDPEVAALGASENVFPQRLVELFREATCVSADYGDVARLRIGIVQRDVLLHSQMQDIFLLIGRRLRVVSDMLAWNGMLDDLEQVRRHPDMSREPMDSCSPSQRLL